MVTARLVSMWSSLANRRNTVPADKFRYGNKLSFMILVLEHLLGMPPTVFGRGIYTEKLIRIRKV